MLERVTLEEAVSIICEKTKRKEEIEIRSVADANGFILAEDIYAGIDNPPFPRSPVDGYAVRSIDIKGADENTPVLLNVTDCIFAGENGQIKKISEKETMRIMTGAPFPLGADCAVKQEDTDYGEESVRIYKELQPYDNYCFQGEDYKKDALLLRKNERITFAEQGILAGIGKTSVKVYKSPRIVIITTGDEICQPGEKLLPGKIYDSNAMMVTARLGELGIMPHCVLHISDNENEMAETMKREAETADLIITTGGVSVGKKDIMHGALELLGAEKLFWKVQLQPGTPSICSVYQDVMIVSLSGNPFGAMANLELLVRPLLYKMTGNTIFQMQKKEGIMNENFTKKSKGRRFVRAIIHDEKVNLPEGILSSGAIGTLRGCNCLLDIPAGNTGIREGERVRVWML